MSLILDTSILISLEKRKEEVISKLKSLRAEYPSIPKITFMTEFEFLVGLAEKSAKNKEKAISFLYQFSILQTSSVTAKILTELKRKYDKKGVQMSLTDLLIATLVIENNDTLLTSDQDFEKIEELDKIILAST